MEHAPEVKGHLQESLQEVALGVQRCNVDGAPQALPLPGLSLGAVNWGMLGERKRV